MAPIKVFIKIEGGIIQNIDSTSPELLDIVIVDYDGFENEGYQDEDDDVIDDVVKQYSYVNKMTSDKWADLIDPNGKYGLTDNEKRVRERLEEMDKFEHETLAHVIQEVNDARNLIASIVANRFSELLLLAIGPKKLDAVVTKNKTPEYAGCCASHDYCDANMVMAEAMKKVTGNEVDTQNERQLDIWNRAWDIAKKNDFKPVEVN